MVSSTRYVFSCLKKSTVFNVQQCIAANFVKGKAEPPSECRNASSVKAYFTDDKALEALVGDSSNSSSETGSASSSATSSAASSTESADAAAALQAWSASGAGFITLLAMAFAGGALMV